MNRQPRISRSGSAPTPMGCPPVRQSRLFIVFSFFFFCFSSRPVPTNRPFPNKSRNSASVRDSLRAHRAADHAVIAARSKQPTCNNSSQTRHIVRCLFACVVKRPIRDQTLHAKTHQHRVGFHHVQWQQNLACPRRRQNHSRARVVILDTTLAAIPPRTSTAVL